MQEEKLEIINSVIISWKALFKNFLYFFATFLIPSIGYMAGLLLFSIGLVLLLQLIAHPNVALVAALVLVATVVGLAMFLYFFWRFLVISASTYIVADKLFKTGEKIEYKEANRAIETRAKDYIILLLLLTGIMILPFIISSLISLPLIVGFPTLITTERFAVINIAGFGLSFLLFVVINLFLVLAIPFFALNENLTPKNCVKLSFSLVGKNFLPTVFLILFFLLTMIPVTLLTLIPILGTIVINFILAIVVTPLTALVLTKWYLEVTEKTPVKEC